MKKLLLFIWIFTLSIMHLQAQCGPGQDTTPPVLSTTQDGTIANPFRNLLQTTVGSVPSGTYYFNFNGSTFQGVLDNDTDGGGWLMILNYVHLAGDNSALNVRNTDLPLLGSSALGDNEAATANWGHMGNALAGDIDFAEMRFYAETTGHSRVIDFTTSYDTALNYVKTGNGSFGGITNASNFTTLTNHTATIPGNTTNTFTDQGDMALTEFPFWRGGNAHWGIRGLGNRWEVDDFPNDNSQSTIHRVWVRGDLSPFVATNTLIATLDTSGNVTVDPTSFGYIATDNCGIANLSLSQASFDCSHIGSNAIQLIATDASNNTANINVTVTIVDSPPMITTDDFVDVDLDPITGMASLTLADLNASAADDCGSATLSISKTNFTCEDIGRQTIQLTATDTNGAISTEDIAVSVNDITAPVVQCMAPFTLELDENGNASISQEDILASFADNCGVSRVRISPSNFSCANLGDNVVSVRVYDNEGNRTNCSTTVTIAVPSCPGNLTLDADIEACGAVYNYPCASNITAGPVSGTLLAVGSTTTFTYDIPDNSGGTSTCTYDVTVNDTRAPLFTTKEHTVFLDANGVATVQAMDLIGPDPLARDYTVETTGTLDRVDISANGTQVTLDDDEVSEALSIGFEFRFYGNQYTEFYISSNGFITFSDDGEDGCCNGQTLPDTSTPNNLIAFDWNDINPEDGGTMRYTTIGTAPDRILIMDWDSVTHIDDNDDITTTQVKLFEGTNRIEIHTINIPLTGDDKTQGLENIDGTAAVVVPGRNAANWGATNDYVAFIPAPAIAENCAIDVLEVTPNTFDWSHTGDNTVTVTATDVNGNTSEHTATVKVTGDCPFGELPDDNFQLQAASETCVDKNNGVLYINATQNFNYIATVNNATYTFNSSIAITDLAPGTYPICIGIEGIEDCEKCYEFVIEESSLLAGKTTIDNASNKVFVDIQSGTAPYTVTINNKMVGEYTTNTFVVDAKSGGVVEVSSSVACQGKLSATIGGLEGATAYPNPTQDNVTLYIPNVNEDVITVEIHNALGTTISSGVYTVSGNKIELSMQNVPSGIYFVSLEGTSKTFRISKQ